MLSHWKWLQNKLFLPQKTKTVRLLDAPFLIQLDYSVGEQDFFLFDHVAHYLCHTLGVVMNL